MKCLEIIEIRSVSTDGESMQQQIIELFEQVAAANPDWLVKIFRNGQVDSDFSIHLLYELPGDGAQLSATGVQIASELKDFGMVNHSVWIQWR